MTFDLPIEYCGHNSLSGTYIKFAQETKVNLCELNTIKVRFLVQEFGKGVDLVDEIIRLKHLYFGVTFEVYHMNGYGEAKIPE